MSQHNALLLTAIKSPLQPGKRTTPTPEAGEVLLKVGAAGLNPHDSKVQPLPTFILTQH